MPADDEQRVLAVVRRMLHAIDYALPQELEQVWTDEGSMFFPFLDSPTLAVGKRPILVRFKALFDKLKAAGAQPPLVGFDLSDHRIEIVGDAALCTFTYPVRGILARRTFFLVRQNGEWRIRHVHGSNSTPT